MYKAITSTFIFFLSFSIGMTQIDTVEMVESEFVPEDITVQAGDTVLWINMGAVVHTSTSGTNCMQDGDWNSGDVSPGEGFGVVLNTPGDYPYFCIPHCEVGMTGSVTVEMASATKTVTVNQNIVHPNPATNYLWIDFSAFDVQKVELEIVNSSGQIVALKDKVTTVGQQHISVSDLQAGVYLLQIKDGNEVIGIQRFVKANH